ncbi:hypothetical protein FOZ63_011232, partial [Perkinsus olseni]
SAGGRLPGRLPSRPYKFFSWQFRVLLGRVAAVRLFGPSTQGTVLVHIDEVEFSLPTDTSDTKGQGESVEDLLLRKNNFVSLLFPAVEELSFSGAPTNWPREWMSIYSQAAASPEAPVERRMSLYKRAFERYRFTIILDDRRRRDFLSEAMINALAWHTVPAYNGYYRVSTMFANAVAAFNETHFELGSFLDLLHDLEKQMKFLWSYQDMLLDVLYYR